MKYNELNIESYKSAKRVGRGIAAGQGKTAGRGTKGQGSRTGKKLRPGFEGGQTPLMQRLPKLRGFRSHHIPAETIYTGQINDLKAKVIDSTALAEAGLVSNPHVKVKLLVKGPELSKAFTVKLTASSQKAVEAIEAAGGSFQRVPRLKRPKTRITKEV